MEPDDIIDKEFTCFEFRSTDRLVTWDSIYESYIGKTGRVIEINVGHPQYAFVEIKLDNGRRTNAHYPTQMIIDKIESESKSIEDLLNEVKHLTAQVWKTKI